MWGSQRSVNEAKETPGTPGLSRLLADDAAAIADETGLPRRNWVASRLLARLSPLPSRLRRGRMTRQRSLARLSAVFPHVYEQA